MHSYSPSCFSIDLLMRRKERSVSFPSSFSEREKPSEPLTIRFACGLFFLQIMRGRGHPLKAQQTSVGLSGVYSFGELEQVPLSTYVSLPKTAKYWYRHDILTVKEAEASISQGLTSSCLLLHNFGCSASSNVSNFELNFRAMFCWHRPTLTTG